MISKNYTDSDKTILPCCDSGTRFAVDNQKSAASRPSNCYRPLQQLYKTEYSPVMSGQESSRINLACICRPSDKYKTTNMTYGSFHYNNWAFMQKNRPVNCEKKKKKSQKSNGNSRPIGPMGLDENQFWMQPTSDACCPKNCCTDDEH